MLSSRCVGLHAEIVPPHVSCGAEYDTFSAVQAIPTSMTTLTLAGCDLLTGVGLGRLSRLQTLRLNSCPQVTEASIQVSQASLTPVSPRYIRNVMSASGSDSSMSDGGLTFAGDRSGVHETEPAAASRHAERQVPTRAARGRHAASHHGLCWERMQFSAASQR